MSIWCNFLHDLKHFAKISKDFAVSLLNLTWNIYWCKANSFNEWKLKDFIGIDKVPLSIYFIFSTMKKFTSAIVNVQQFVVKWIIWICNFLFNLKPTLELIECSIYGHWTFKNNFISTIVTSIRFSYYANFVPWYIKI